MAIIKIRNAAIDLDAAEIPNLPATKITSGTFDNARISLDAAEIPNLDTAKITTGTLADARVPNLNASKITAGTIATARLGSGTANSSTFLRGDNTFAAAGGVNTPAFNIDLNATQNVSSLTSTKVALNTARIDTDSGFDSSNNRWVVPSGKGGTYYIGFEINGASGDGRSKLNFIAVSLKINGSSYIGTNIDWRDNPGTEGKANANFIIALSAGDYLEIFGNNYVVSGQAYFGGGNSNAERNKSHLYGFRLIT